MLREDVYMLDELRQIIEEGEVSVDATVALYISVEDCSCLARYVPMQRFLRHEWTFCPEWKVLS
jgi:hypothetical protein